MITQSIILMEMEIFYHGIKHKGKEAHECYRRKLACDPPPPQYNTCTK
jgi:hypothetical protein